MLRKRYLSKPNSRKIIVLILFVLMANINTPHCIGQVALSEAFQKTVSKIAKEKTKESVLYWISEQDPTVGIIAHDLIEQIIDSNDEQQLIVSNISVLTTMLFIYGIQNHIDELLDVATMETVVLQAAETGWSRSELVAYSSLYYYYSERLKKKLFVSPYILNMKDVKGKVESFRCADGKKWSAFVSGKLVNSRRKEFDITLDVRAVEVLRVSLLRKFSEDSNVSISEPFIDDMCKDYLKADVKRDWLLTWENSKSLDDLRPFLFEELYQRLDNAVKKVNAVKADTVSWDSESAIRKNNEQFSVHAMHQLVLPFLVYLRKESVWDRPPDYSREEIISNLRVILSNWLNNASTNQWGFGYRVMLAGTYLSLDEKIDFTVFDHLRWGYKGVDWAIYGFIGGFIDPLIKQSINKDGSRIYSVGIGFTYRDFNLMPIIGIPYEEITDGKYQVGLTFGYEIPLTDLTD